MSAWTVIEVNNGEPLFVGTFPDRQTAIDSYNRWDAERQVMEGEKPDYTSIAADPIEALTANDGALAWDQQGWQLYIMPSPEGHVEVTRDGETS